MPPLVVTPLTVSENSCGKKRLILDLRYINQFVWKDRFKLDDWKTMMQYVKKGGYIFNFDLRSGYHHLDLFQSHQPYTGFSFLQDQDQDSFLLRVELDIFFFIVLCFGLTSGPYIFTKLLRPLVRHWRSQGIQIAVFLDEGAGTIKKLTFAFLKPSRFSLI